MEKSSCCYNLKIKDYYTSINDFMNTYLHNHKPVAISAKNHRINFIKIQGSDKFRSIL